MDPTKKPDGRRKPVFAAMKGTTGSKAPPALIPQAPLDEKVDQLKATPADFKTGKTLRAPEPEPEPEEALPPPQTIVRGRTKLVKDVAASLRPPEPIALPRIPSPGPVIVRRRHSSKAPVEEEEPTKKERGAKRIRKYKQQEQEEQEKEHYQIESPPPAFVPPTRRGFTTFFDSTFAEEGEHAHQFALPLKKIGESDPDACLKLKASTDIQSFTYQQFIAEYLRRETPYRGLLVYHGLGSGKTCSAIAAAEAIFGSSFVPVLNPDGSVATNTDGTEKHEPTRKIIVMTPGSLRANFQGEISKCGFRHFRLRTNHWVFIKTDSENATVRNFALTNLNISPKYYKGILARPKERRGIWIPDFDKEPNYDELDSDSQTDIRAQILDIIENRIMFINYNGATVKKLMQLVCEAAENPGKPGPFDNSVIVIDEIHNLSRLMQGKLHPYMEEISMKAGRKRAIPPEPVTAERWKPAACGTSKSYTRALLLYRLIAEAKNSKIIGLSGTPLINFPDELGPLFNMIGGYTHAARITMADRTDAAKEAFRRLAEEHPRVDFVQFTAGQTDTAILFTTFLDGYVKVVDGAGKFIGLRENETPTKNTKEVALQLIDAAKRAGLTIKGEPTLESYPVLPVNPKEFNKYFVNTETLTPTNTNVLKKRLYGLVSYYKGASPDLMPKMVEDRVVRVRFSDYALQYYTKKRVKEIADSPEELAQEEEVDPFGDMESQAKSANPANYRFNSRAACNFAFPSAIPRPYRSKANEDTPETDERAGATISDEAYDVDADAAEVAQAAAEDEAVKGADEEDLVEGETEGVITGGPGMAGGGSCPTCTTISCTGAACSAPVPMSGGGDEDDGFSFEDDEFVGGTVAKLPNASGGGKKEEEKKKASEMAKRLLAEMGLASPAAEEAPTTLRVKRAKEVPVEEEPKTIRRGREPARERSVSRKASKPEQEAEPEPVKRTREHTREPARERSVSRKASKPEQEAEPAPPVKRTRERSRAPSETPKPVEIDGTTVIKRRRKDKKEMGPEMKAIMDRFLTKVAAEAKARGFDIKDEEAPEEPSSLRRVQTYLERLDRQLNKLREQRSTYLRLDGPPDNNLEKYSPKYAAMLRNINDPEVIPGTSLVYSQFYKAEGLGIFGYALEANGYTRIDLKGETELTAESEASLRLGPAHRAPDGKMVGQRFAFFTGDGTPAQRKIILNIFNGNLAELPPKIKRVMVESGFENMGNKNGEICKVIGITGAGAEGISLKFVRGVHIMEPFWNDVRLEQVKGRAIRICSHAELPPEERTVSVYTYVAAFDKQDEDENRIVPTLMTFDKGITSDQRVLEISERKKQLSESFIRILKEVAVDCTLNSTGDEDLVCYEGIKGEPNKESHLPEVGQDVAAGDIEEKIMYKRTTTTAADPATTKSMQQRRTGRLKDGREVFLNEDPETKDPNIFLAYLPTDKMKRNPVARLVRNPITGKFTQTIFGPGGGAGGPP